MNIAYMEKTQKKEKKLSRRTVLSAGILGVLGFGLTGCKTEQQVTQVASLDLSDLSVTLYKSPTCGCCELYMTYLESYGIEAQVVEETDVSITKKELGIPSSVWSCHTMKINGYFVEGHVPMEAIQKLLETQPDIDGIALAGMPAGSPGMSGTKEEPFIIYAISNGEISEFMRI